MKINFQKKDIAKILSIKIGYSALYSKKLLNDLLRYLSLNICEGGINLKNFGTFKILKKNQRIGRNPKTKDEFIISSRKTIKFKSSKKLLSALNKIS